MTRSFFYYEKDAYFCIPIFPVINDDCGCELTVDNNKKDAMFWTHGLTMEWDGMALTGLRFAEKPDDIEMTSNPVFELTCHWLDIYFSVRKPDFLPPLSPRGTPFQKSVWREMLKIQYGQTVPYGELARRIGCRSAQAVGQAVAHNPIAVIIPCHRVVGANSIGGYAYGPTKKLYLLQLEKENRVLESP